MTQLRHCGSDPLGFGVAAGDALAGRRVFDEALAIPHQHAGIKRVIDDAGAAADMAADGRVAP